MLKGELIGPRRASSGASLSLHRERGTIIPTLHESQGALGGGEKKALPPKGGRASLVLWKILLEPERQLVADHDDRINL
jgi:hypothetical protein